MSVKIKLKRLGKKKNPQYRIVVADSRTARGGRSIEEIGIYQPRREPSLIQVDSERAQYWLGVGAQPTEPVMAILKVTGDWQKFKGLPGAEGTLRVAEPKADKQMAFEAAVKSAEAAGKAPKAKALTAEAAPVVEAVEPRPRRSSSPSRSSRRSPVIEEAPVARPMPRLRRQHLLQVAEVAADVAECSRGRRGRRGDPLGMSTVIEDSLEHLVSGIVEHPEDVSVRVRSGRRGPREQGGNTFQVRVHPDDIGRVIGRGGRTATAIRTVVSAISGGRPVRVDFLDADER